jgi:hypothetical protein
MDRTPGRDSPRKLRMTPMARGLEDVGTAMSKITHAKRSD